MYSSHKKNICDWMIRMSMLEPMHGILFKTGYTEIHKGSEY